MKRTFIFLALACAFISCEDKVSEDFPVWTPSLTATRGDGIISLRWYNPMAWICMMPNQYSEPQAFEVYLAEGIPDHFEKVEVLKNTGSYSFTINDLENGVYYYVEVKATGYFKPDATSNTVMVIPSGNENVVRFGADGNQSMESGSLSGDSHTLAFTDMGFTWNNGQYGSTALYALDMDSHESIIVDTSAYFPDWSPAAPKLVYCTDKHEFSIEGYRPQQIAVFDLSTGTVTRLTEGDDINTNPEFSPDGNWIAYSSDAGHHGAFEIWKMTADGSQKEQISDDLQFSGLNFGNIGLGRPVWSPDAAFIYFNTVSEEDIDMDIFRIPADGGTIEPVVQSPWNDYIPAVSPDQSKIAFISDRSGTDQIWLYEPASDRYRQVTGDGRFTILTFWGKLEWPDGNRILFTGYEHGNDPDYGIFAVEVPD